MKAIILAGGFATRLWPLTEKTAKPLVSLAGKPMISWIIESLPDDIEIFVSTNSAFTQNFVSWKEKYFPTRNIKIFTEDSKNEKEKKGALYATSLALQENKINEDTLIIAGDNYFGFSFTNFFNEFHCFPNDPLLAVYDIKDVKRSKNFGVVVPKRDTKEVQDFQEKPEHPRSTLVATGCFLLPQKNIPDLVYFAEKNKDDLGKIFEYFLSKKNTIRYFSFDQKWFDIGSFSAYLSANICLLGGKILKGSGISLSKDAILKNSVFLGNGVQIGKNVMIQDFIVLEGSVLENCYIQNAVIGKNAFISGVDISHKILRDESFVMS